MWGNRDLLHQRTSSSERRRHLPLHALYSESRWISSFRVIASVDYIYAVFSDIIDFGSSYLLFSPLSYLSLTHCGVLQVPRAKFDLNKPWNLDPPRRWATIWILFLAHSCNPHHQPCHHKTTSTRNRQIRTLCTIITHPPHRIRANRLSLVKSI